MGMPVNVSFSYYNTGKVTLNNLMIRIEGDVETETRNTYIGNLESGSSDYYESNFIPTTIGKVPVSIIVSYDDASGESVEERRDFMLNVIEPMPMEDIMGMEDMQGNTPNHKVLLISIVLGIIAIAAVIVVVTLVKRKKKKAEEAFLAEEDDFAPEDVDYYETMPNQSSQNREGRDRNEHF